MPYLLLEQLAAQEREAHGGKAGDQLIEIGLERGHLGDLEAGGTERRELAQGLMDALSTRGQARPIDIGAGGLLNRGDDRGEGDAHPALHERTDDEHAQDGGTLGDLAHKTAGEVLGDGGANLVAELLGVQKERDADDVPHKEEQQRTQDGATERQGISERAEDRAKP